MGRWVSSSFSAPSERSRRPIRPPPQELAARIDAAVAFHWEKSGIRQSSRAISQGKHAARDKWRR
jgi:hypothetical protein